VKSEKSPLTRGDLEGCLMDTDAIYEFRFNDEMNNCGKPNETYEPELTNG